MSSCGQGRKDCGLYASFSLTTQGLASCPWHWLGSSLLWALGSGPVATLALSPDPLPKLITCSFNDRHFPSMHQQQAIYVLDWLLCLMKRQTFMVVQTRRLHSSVALNSSTELLCVEMERKASSPFLDTVPPSPYPPMGKKKIKTKIYYVRKMREKYDFSSRGCIFPFASSVFFF